MNKNPLISIVMNCYNGEQYLKESVLSILNQTYKNWELIFWNNKSSDRSEIIIKSFKDKRIKYYCSTKLEKLYHARNLAVKKANGEYICFLDSDDLWRKNKLKIQLLEFQKNDNLILSYTNFYQFNEKNKKKEIFFKNKLPSGKITQKLLDNYSIGILTVMLRRKVFDLYKFNSKYNIIGDFDFFIRLSIKFKINSIQRPLAFYRLHLNNYSNNNLKEYDLEISNWLKSNKKKLKRHGFSLIKLQFTFLKFRIKNYLSDKYLKLTSKMGM